MGRRGDGVEIRENSLRVQFVLEAGGKPVRRTLMRGSLPMRPTPANIKYAQRLVAEIREKIRQGVFVMAEFFPEDGGTPTPGTSSVGQRLDIWLAAQRVQASTKAGYESSVRFWKAAQYDPKKPLEQMGELPVRQLTATMISTALATKPNLSGKTINNYVSVLRKALSSAMDDGILTANPVDGVKRAKWQKSPPDPFSLPEIDAMCDYARRHYPPEVADMIEWWAFSGPRTGELFGLRWPNVHLEAKLVHIAETTVRGEHKDSTKTDVARDVLQNSRAIAAIRRQRARTLEREDGFVWVDPRYDTPWSDERAFRRSYWTPMLGALEIRYRRPYNLRHSYATMMLMAGRTPAWCAGQMGHSVEMFLTTYARWLAGDQDAVELAGLERWLNAPGRAAGGS